jgi:hypothetical protein
LRIIWPTAHRGEAEELTFFTRVPDPQQIDGGLLNFVAHFVMPNKNPASFAGFKLSEFFADGAKWGRTRLSNLNIVPDPIYFLQLVLGDINHVPYDPPILSDNITITVQ